MKHIGIVGSRKRREYERILQILTGLEKKYNEITVVSGGALGIDDDAQLACKELGIPILILYPKLQEYSQKGNNIYFSRNWKIAEKCDFLYAFPLDRKGGTMNTVGHFKNFNKENNLIIID